MSYLQNIRKLGTVFLDVKFEEEDIDLYRMENSQGPKNHKDNKFFLDGNEQRMLAQR